jgi:hypothetical protein
MTKEQIVDLNLALLYLTGWEEDSRKTPGERIYRSWKGYLFENLNALTDQKLIIQFAKENRSVIITDAGRQKAQEFIAKLLPENAKSKKTKTA